jgi:predicted kinase
VPGRFLLQMAGPSGTGKSTLARALAGRTGAAVLDLDVLKSVALDAGAAWDLAGRLGYECSWAVADSLLAQSLSVVLDSPCRFHRIITEGTAIADRRGAAYGFIECALADPEELRRRLRGRPRLRSQMTDLGVPSPDAPADTFVAQVRAFGPAVLETKYPPGPWLRIDTSRPVEDCLELALAYVERLRRPGDGGGARA